jgi:hypothetical protein
MLGSQIDMFFSSIMVFVCQVSRRKDGQRFKLKIEADREQCTTNVDDLSPVFTNAICVLSKRKHHSYQVDNNVRFKELSNKICRRGEMILCNKIFSVIC